MSLVNLSNLLASQMTGYEPYTDTFTYDNLKKITYVMAANGVFRVEKTPVAVFKTQIAKHEKEIPGLNHMVEGPELLIPKIPFRFLQQALSFYLDVYDKDKTEASLLFFWNTNDVPLPKKYSDNKDVKGLLVEGKLVVYCPRQKNSSGLSEFHMDPMVQWLRDNLSILMETHSHHTMNAFFSGTDDANENATQFYGVWGKIKNQQPQFAFRYCSGDAKVQICPSVLIDWPMVRERTIVEVTADIEGFQPERYVEETENIYAGPFPKIDYPSEWLGQHTAAASTFKKPSYGSKYSYGKKYQSPSYNDQMSWGDETLDAQTPSYFEPMEYADIIRLENVADEKKKKNIEDNIYDLAADYSALGYDRIIEKALEATKGFPK